MQTLTRIKAAALAVCVFAAPVANAATLNVPGDFPTIQAAIDAAVNGDVVLIAPGVYTGEGNRDLDTLGKAITIRGDGGGDPAMVVIDAQGTSSDPHRGFIMQSGETRETALEAFTIRNGNAGQGSAQDGGGLHLSGGASPLIQNIAFESCRATASGGHGGAVFNIDGSPRFENCSARANVGGDGGGMYYGSQQSGDVEFVGCVFRESEILIDDGIVLLVRGGTLLIEGCDFLENRPALGADGDGVCAISGNVPAIVRGCRFEENFADDGGAFQGAENTVVEDCIFRRNVGDKSGGVVRTSSNSGGIVFRDCIFEENIADFGGVISGEGSFYDCTFLRNEADAFGAGGVSYGQAFGHSVFVNCYFEGNVAQDFYGVGEGTFINCHLVDNHAGWNYGVGLGTFINCELIGNTSVNYGGAVGGGPFINCTFISSSASDRGGTIYVEEGEAVVLTNCTIVASSSPGDGAIAYIETNGTLTAHNCIFWDNPGVDFAGPGTITISYSDVEGGFPGTGNIDADPLFINAAAGDYRLSPGSPCIDAGDNLALPPDKHDLDNDGDTTEPLPIDLFGLARRVDDPNTTDTGNGTPPIVDMGAYEFQTQGTAAMFADVAVEFGTHLGGNLKSLRVSDDERYEMQSQFGFSAMEPNIAQMRLGVMNHAPLPDTIVLRLESMLNNPGGSVTLRMRDWGTNVNEVVHQFATSQRDTITTANGIDASRYIRASDGRAELSARFAVIATFAASGFEARVDQAVVFVE